MDGGAWWATVHGVAKSQTRLSDFTHSLTQRKGGKWYREVHTEKSEQMLVCLRSEGGNMATTGPRENGHLWSPAHHWNS